MRAIRRFDGEAVDVATARKRRRHVTFDAGLELRGDTFARLHHVDEYSIAGIALSFGLSAEQVRLDIRAAERRAKAAERRAREG